MKTQLVLMPGEITESLFLAPQGNFGNNKPLTGGFWTSSEIEPGISDWIDFAISEGIYDEEKLTALNLYSIEVCKSANVLVIDSRQDYMEALETYGESIIGNQRLSNICFMHEKPVILDYKLLKEDYDGLQLTKKGRLENSNEFFCWDCESTVWFNINKFEKIKSLGGLKNVQIF